MTIEKHNPNWKTEFEGIARILGKALSGQFVSIEHVGSTSIPDLVAKPILDIDIVISPVQSVKEISDRLKRLGYQARGDQGIPGRFAFKPSTILSPLSFPPKFWQKHHLYVCYADSLALKNHLTFRKALLSNPELVKDYTALKKELVREADLSPEKYCRLKTDFIIGVLEGAGLAQNELLEIRRMNA